MKKIFILFGLLTIIVAVFAFGSCGEKTSKNLDFIIDKEAGTVKIVGRGDCRDAQIVIPSKIKGYPITEIGADAFKDDKNITSVTIPDGVTSIGMNAFFGCTGLKKIVFTGTQSQWNEIKKGSLWNYNTGHLAIYCMDDDTGCMDDRYGAFSVTTPEFANVRYALTLSETTDFTSPVSRLNSKASVDITNIDGSSLPNDLDNIDGEHNGKNYLAYTFYCKNAGQEAVTYRWTLAIKNASQEIEKAVRVRLYVNGEPTTYARTRTDGSGVEMDMDKNGNRTIPTTEFWKGSTIAQGEFADFQVGDITKYTIVVWLEGHDPDCVDDIIGGNFQINMEMN